MNSPRIIAARPAVLPSAAPRARLQCASTVNRFSCSENMAAFWTDPCGWAAQTSANMVLLSQTFAGMGRASQAARCA